MFLHVDHIKEIADLCREHELKKTIRAKLERMKIDFTQRSYLDTVLKNLHAFSPAYLHEIEPYFANGNPPIHALRAIKHDIEQGRTRRKAPFGKPLEDRVRGYLALSDFDPYEITSFVALKAEQHRDERARGLTVGSARTFDELLKIEFEVGERLQDGRQLLKALYRAVDNDASGAKYAAQKADESARTLFKEAYDIRNGRESRKETLAARKEDEAQSQLALATRRTADYNYFLKQAHEIERAQLLLEGRYSETRSATARIERQRDEYLARMKPKPVVAAAKP